MVVEHTFITTLEPEQAMQTALNFLQERGFVSDGPSGFRFANDAWTSLKVRRGKTTVRAAMNAVELPQTVRLEWDRGRVVVAASMDVPAKQLPAHQSLLVNIATALEELLARRVAPAHAGQSLRYLEESLVEEARRKRRKRTTTLLVVLVIVIALIAFAIFMATQS
jgi:hypothetical protein